MQAFNEYKIQLKGLEDDLLYKLANAPADILSDIPLIEGLESTKRRRGRSRAPWPRARRRRSGLMKLGKFIDRSRPGVVPLLHAPAAQQDPVRVSIFISVVRDLLLQRHEARGHERRRQKTRRRSFVFGRWTIFQWVARGLFERHRLVFLVQVVVGLLQQGLNDTPEDGGEAARGRRSPR